VIGNGGVVDAGGKRPRVGTVLQLPLVRVPVADVDDKGDEHEEQRNQNGREHEDRAALVTECRTDVPQSPAVRPPHTHSPSSGQPPPGAFARIM